MGFGDSGGDEFVIFFRLPNNGSLKDKLSFSSIAENISLSF
jgi:hypothetical protein